MKNIVLSVLEKIWRYEMVKLRVQGLPEEVEEFVKNFKNNGYRILQQSGEYKNRNSEYVRVYIETEPKKNK